MAEKKIKCIKVTILGTGLNASFYVLDHKVQAYQASTYHIFTYLNDVEVWKNDFGVSSIFKEQVEIEPSAVPTPQQI